MDKRTFVLPEPAKKELKEVKQKPPPKIRKAADAWAFANKDELTFEQQLLILENKDLTNPLFNKMKQQITNKIHSYRSQDIKKSLLDSDKLVDTEFVINLLLNKQCLCFYCREPTLVLYDEVRAAKQWTLDRMDNSQGHNKNNVEIACLTCNLRRRTMYHERYVFTKQLNIVKLG